MYCVKCEKEMNYLHESKDHWEGNINDGGAFSFSFGYGSKFEMIGNPPKSEARIHQLLACSDIIGFICDDCFEKYSYLFNGYKIINPKYNSNKYEKVIT